MVVLLKAFEARGIGRELGLGDRTTSVRSVVDSNADTAKASKGKKRALLHMTNELSMG